MKRAAFSLLVLLFLGASCSPQGEPSASPSPGSSPPSPSPQAEASPPPSPSPFEKVAYDPAECPTDAIRGITLQVSCGYLTVPEDRSASTTRAIRLLVVRVVPDEPASDDPMFALGLDYPWISNYPGVAPLATRVHREVIMPAMRGDGRSEPRLVCTEIEDLATAELPLGDDPAQVVDLAPRPAFMAAVRACHDRLTGAGVNLAAYNLAESAADVEDLRVALGFESVNLLTLGTMSRVAFEVMRRYPDHIRAAVFDTPSIPGVDMFTEAILGTRASLETIAADCLAEARCDAAYPDLAAAMAQAMTRLAAEPFVHPHPIRPVLLDDVVTLRWLRTAMAAGQVAETPSYIESLAGGLTVDDVMARTATFPILSLGYAEGAPYDVSPGSWEGDWSHGLQFSIACHDQLPFVDRDTLLEVTADEPWYRRAFLESPFVEICERWDVGVGDSSTNEPVQSAIPSLLLVGRYDPFAIPAIVEEHTGGLSARWLVELPHAHNVLGYDDGCARSIRNAWIDNPATAPDTACVTSLPGPMFLVP